MSVEPPSDLALLRRYHAAQDLDAVQQLIDRHQTSLLRLASAMVADHQVAQDAVQDALLALVKQREVLLNAVDRPHLGGWLATVVRNACIDHLRRPRLVTAAAEVAAELPPESASADSESAHQIWSAVDTLPELHRAAVLLRYRDGLSYADIASALDKTVNHVGVLLHEGLARLRGSPQLQLQVEASS